MIAKLKNKIIDIEGNECKIYDLDYLINTELTEEDLYYLFDTASLIYSLVVGEFKFVGYDNISDEEIINICKTNERWVYEYYWTKKQHDEYIKKVTAIYKIYINIKQILQKMQQNGLFFNTD